MSEWVSVLAVFWLLWMLDGVRLSPRRLFSALGRGRQLNRASLLYSRLSLPSPLPWGWRVITADIPFSLSPTGISNQPAGAAGRPVENPPRFQAWRWEEIREVGVARGWIYVNGEPFCPDTRHLAPAQLLELARLPAERREKALRDIIARWFRTANLRRRVRSLAARTRGPATANTIAVAAFALLSVYVVGDFASRLPPEWSERLADLLPWLLAVLLALHVFGMVAAWRAARRLKPIAAEKRMANLFSALLLPPQALRLRSLLADGFFPPVHPLTLAVAFGSKEVRSAAAFNVLADLRWPLAGEGLAEPSEEIAVWFRAAVASESAPLLASAGIASDALFAPPLPDAPASRSYCPRCRDQFVAGPTRCPHGIPLMPLNPGQSSNRGAEI